MSGSQITDRSLHELVPKEGGIGLSFLGLTSCELITLPSLHKVAPYFLFSYLKSNATFEGFLPKENESELRKAASIKYCKRLASTNIERMARGVIVRTGIWREKRNAWYGKYPIQTKDSFYFYVPDQQYKLSFPVANGILKIQAHFRRREQVVKYDYLRKARNECIAAHTIQKTFKDYKWNIYRKELLMECLLQRKRLNAAITIQRYCRGHVGKLRASHHKHIRQSMILHAAKLKATCVRAAIILQKMTRGVQARSQFKRILLRREISITEHLRQLISSITIQRFARGFIDRATVKQLRIESDLVEEQWYRARQIQCAWKISKACTVFERLKHFQEVKIHHQKALKLQSLWRLRLALQRVRMVRGLRDLRRLERHSCIKIQKGYRGMRGRKRSRERKAQIIDTHIRLHAVSFIQRLYRGFKGRELSFVERYLQAKTRPLRSQIKEKDEKIRYHEESLSEYKQNLKGERHLQEVSLLHLKAASNSNNDFIDSTIVNGVLQRCEKSLVMVRFGGTSQTLMIFDFHLQNVLLLPLVTSTE